MKSGTGILPVGLGGIGILPMIHGLEAHATLNRVSIHVLKAGRTASRPANNSIPDVATTSKRKRRPATVFRPHPHPSLADIGLDALVDGP